MLLEEAMWSLQARVASLEEEAEGYSGITAHQAVMKWLTSHKCVSAPVLAYETGHTPSTCRKAISVLCQRGQLVPAHPGSHDGIYLKSPTKRYLTDHVQA